jgi:hypothetical protein
MTAELHLATGGIVILDDTDIALVCGIKWYGTPLGRTVYAQTCRKIIGGHGKQKTLLMHRVIMNPPTDMVVDHINGNGLDNRRSNLRIVTRGENSRLARNIPANRSGFRGVSWSSKRGKWRAAIGFYGVDKSIGYFSDAADAAMAYDVEAIKARGDLAVLNFPRNKT